MLHVPTRRLSWAIWTLTLLLKAVMQELCLSSSARFFSSRSIALSCSALYFSFNWSWAESKRFSTKSDQIIDRNELAQNSVANYGHFDHQNSQEPCNQRIFDQVLPRTVALSELRWYHVSFHSNNLLLGIRFIKIGSCYWCPFFP